MKGASVEHQLACHAEYRTTLCKAREVLDKPTVGKGRVRTRPIDWQRNNVKSAAVANASAVAFEEIIGGSEDASASGVEENPAGRNRRVVADEPTVGHTQH